MAQQEQRQLSYTNKARYLRPFKGITLPGLFLLLLFAVFLIPNISLAGGINMTVTSTVPTDNATGVTPDSNVTINFDYNLNCATVNTTTITSDSPGWAFSSCTGSQAVFSTSGQASSTSYTQQVSKNVESTAGYTLQSPTTFSGSDPTLN